MLDCSSKFYFCSKFCLLLLTLQSPNFHRVSIQWSTSEFGIHIVVHFVTIEEIINRHYLFLGCCFWTTCILWVYFLLSDWFTIAYTMITNIMWLKIRIGKVFGIFQKQSINLTDPFPESWSEPGICRVDIIYLNKHDLVYTWNIFSSSHNWD